MPYRDNSSRVAAGLGCVAGLTFFIWAVPMMLFGPISSAGAHVLFWWTAILLGPFVVAYIIGKLINRFSRLRR